MKNNYNLPPSEFDIYCEGIFDRLRARGAGLINKLTGGPTSGGYNQGKSMSFKAIFKGRMVKDIDKFLREVTKLGVADLAEFEQKYPDIAQKIACMADQVGHTTPLRTQCKQNNSTPPPPPPPPVPPTTPPPVPPTTAPPVPPKKKTWSCGRDGKCRPRYDGQGKYKSKQECEAKCTPRQGGGGGSSSGSSSGQTQIAGGNQIGNAQQSGSGNTQYNQTIMVFDQTVIQALAKGLPINQAIQQGMQQANIPQTPSNVAKAKKKAVRLRNKKGQFTKKTT